MSAPGSLSAALDYLPRWWADAADPAAFDALLTGWVRAGGWRAGGFVWPAEPPAAINRAYPAVGEPVSPRELAEAVRLVRDGSPTAAVASTAGRVRVFAPVAPAGRPVGLLWAERATPDPWPDAERSYLALAGRTVERSPALAAVAGAAIDSEKLTQRLADAAVIAGRMAHDFDNILTGILGFADLTLPLIPDGSPQASYLAEITRAGQRGQQFTHQLHQLSRGGQPKPTPGSVAATLTREEQRLRSLLPAGVRVEKDLPADLPGVAVEAGPLQTALGHLFENAVEACGAAGTVRVSARLVELSADDRAGYLGAVGPGPHVLVTVADTGPGIKPEVRRRLFAEPFYTTKVRHRGLGLAVVFRVVAAHKGGVRLDPAPPPATGTVARVVFPLAVARPPVLPPTPSAVPPGTYPEPGRPTTAFTARG